MALPLNSNFSYFAHAQAVHSHESQVQNSPLQSGHLQTTQPQLAAFAATGLAVRVLQHDFVSVADGLTAARSQSQAAHAHTSQVQPLPEHPSHAQPAFDLAAQTDCPASAMTHNDPRTTTA